jgi:hypothetical protein
MTVVWASVLGSVDLLHSVSISLSALRPSQRNPRPLFIGALLRVHALSTLIGIAAFVRDSSTKLLDEDASTFVVMVMPKMTIPSCLRVIFSD